LLAIGRKLRAAQKIENILTTYGVVYCIELDEYTDFFSMIFGSRRIGVFFYVLPEVLSMSQELLKQNRLGSYLATDTG
jgi:hypothetical protein